MSAKLETKTNLIVNKKNLVRLRSTCMPEPPKIDPDILLFIDNLAVAIKAEVRATIKTFKEHMWKERKAESMERVRGTCKHSFQPKCFKSDKGSKYFIPNRQARPDRLCPVVACIVLEQ